MLKKKTNGHLVEGLIVLTAKNIPIEEAAKVNDLRFLLDNGSITMADYKRYVASNKTK